VYGYVREVLAEKGSAVHTIPVGATVREAVREMNAHGIGALLVLRTDEVAGIFTERDVLRRVVDAGMDPNKTRVADMMTSPVFTITSATRVADCMEMMTERRCRHLPVVDDGQLVGMISIGDLLRWVTRVQQEDIEQMTEYITGAQGA
jgi:CBS domain-containing protein